MDGGDKNIWLIANWKSNKTIAEALDWVSKVGPKVPKRDDLKVVVCPTFSCLSEVKKAVQVGNFPIMVGSQDLSPFEVGAYTGEEAASLLKGLVLISILGHSERRQNFSESDEMVAKKVEQALQNGIIPLVCVQGPDTPVPDGCKLVAYEPVFAIGTGNPDIPENANNVAKVLKEKHGPPAGGLEVLYGGSVTSENIKNFINMPNLCGSLIGNASLDAEEFIKIVGECSKL
ncbi:triosephosphate isomerase [Candidatus Microgenomates bacterium]|nr:triosephosphate isomerase [Candidatus Microgenomates bacterium]